MPRSALVPLPDLIHTFEEIYKRDGYVRWAEVASIHGITRQAVHARIQDAQHQGFLHPEDVARWRSMSSRAALSRRRRDIQELHRRFRLDIQLTSENYAWLDAECVSGNCTRTDVVNGLINKARTAEHS
jgi:predicted transcriptional regulator